MDCNISTYLKHFQAELPPFFFMNVQTIIFVWFTDGVVTVYLLNLQIELPQFSLELAGCIPVILCKTCRKNYHKLYVEWAHNIIILSLELPLVTGWTTASILQNLQSAFSLVLLNLLTELPEILCTINKLCLGHSLGLGTTLWHVVNSFIMLFRLQIQSLPSAKNLAMWFNNMEEFY